MTSPTPIEQEAQPLSSTTRAPLIHTISANQKLRLVNWRELWAFREVFHDLVIREIHIRYAHSVVGVGWVILQPLLSTLVLTLLFRRWVTGPFGSVPYTVFAFSGFMAWGYFSHVLTKSSMCLVYSGVLSKVYFPRILLPLSTAVGGLVDLFVASAILCILMIYYRIGLGLHLVALPASLLLLVITTLAIGVWLSVLNLYHRDISHALPFATQILFFLTPIAYSTSLIPQRWRLIYSLNPMIGVIQSLRWALFGGKPDLSLFQLLASSSIAVLLLLSGLFYFASKEPTMADVGEA